MAWKGKSRRKSSQAWSLWIGSIASKILCPRNIETYVLQFSQIKSCLSQCWHENCLEGATRVCKGAPWNSNNWCWWLKYQVMYKVPKTKSNTFSYNFCLPVHLLIWCPEKSKSWIENLMKMKITIWPTLGIWRMTVLVPCPEEVTLTFMWRSTATFMSTATWSTTFKSPTAALSTSSSVFTAGP